MTWTLVIIEVARLDINRDNFTQVLGTVSVWFGGTVTSMRIVENYRHRDVMSFILTEINAKVKRSRLVASQERNNESNKLFLFLSWASILGTFIIVGFAFTVTAGSVVTGEKYFSLALPFERPYLSLSWWVEVLVIQFVTMYCGIFFSLMEGILIDAALQLTFLFKVKYDNILNLQPSDPDANQKFGAVVSELVELKE